MSKNKIRHLVYGLSLPVMLAGILGFNTAATRAAGNSLLSTTTLAYTDVTVSASTPVEITYPKMQEVRYEAEYSSAVFGSYIVENGDYVSEGDPIVSITTTIDEIDLLEAQMDLERARNDYSAYQSEAATALALAEKNVKESKGTARKIAKLQLEKLQINQAATDASYQANIQSLEDKVTGYESERDTSYVYAPANGQVYFYWDRKFNGDSLQNGTPICFLLETDQVLFSIDNSGGLFRYNMPVLLRGGDGNTYKGHIASCDSPMLSSSLISDSAYIVADEEIPVEAYEGMEAAYDSISIKHVITVPTGAYGNDDNGTYVYEVTDAGGIMKHYFTPGRILSDYVIAIDGLSEGMVIQSN